MKKESGPTSPQKNNSVSSLAMNAPQKPGKGRLLSPWIIILTIVLLSAALRIRILDVALERDEGEYAYAGQLILQGIPPYVLVYNMKFPGIYACYALILAVFGESPRGIHFGLLLMNALTIILVFLLGRRLVDQAAGLMAAAAFALLSLSSRVLGFTANAEHFVLLPALAGLLVLLKSRDRGSLGLVFAAGLLLGAATMVKQQGAAFALLGGLWFLVGQWRRQPFRWPGFLLQTGVFVLAGVLPFLNTCLLMWAAGVFDTFWLWTVQYARAYVSQVPLSQAPQVFFPAAGRVMRGAWPIYLTALAGLGFTLWARPFREQRWLILSFCLFSFLAVCPGFFFREHYFLFLTPAIALLAGVCVSWVARQGTDWQSVLQSAGKSPGWPRLAPPLLTACLPLFLASFSERQFLFVLNPMQISRQAYGYNPFPESPAIADYIRANTPDDQTIAVLGSEPQIYFYAHRRSATGFIYTYALVEDQPFALEMQEQMIREIEVGQPAYLVLVGTPTSWLVTSSSPQRIFAWMNQYISKHYVVDGLVDIQGPDQTVYSWGPAAAALAPKSVSYVLLFKRK